MLRSLALISLASGSLVWLGCSNDDTMIHYPPVLTGDMADTGTGGNGGTGGTGGGGGGGSGTDDMGANAQDMAPVLPDLAGLPAPTNPPTTHPPLMQESSYSKSSTITAPEIYTVVWSGDAALGAQVNDFNTWMLASSYWKTGMADYGVGAGSAKGVIVLSAMPPATLTDGNLQDIITAGIGSGSGWPASVDANTIISFVLDSKTSNTSNGGSCVAYDGYHSLTMSGVPYLVNAYCLDENNNPDWNNLTVTMSHEAAEAASDWDLAHNSVVAKSGNTKIPMLGGGEIGDMCLSLNATLQGDGSNMYQVQRLYSQTVAVANNDEPCLPADPGTQWFGAGWVMSASSPESITITRNSQSKTGSAKVNIETWEMDPSFGPIGFYVVGSLLPTGVTMTPNININVDAQGNQTGAVAYANAGGVTPVTINVASTYLAVGLQITLLLISRNETKTHYQIWWGSLLIK